MLQERPDLEACVNPLFATRGPLHSYGAKAQLARALNFIFEWEYADLDRIRELRNHFAHTYDVVSFTDHKAIEISKQLEAAKRRLRARPSQGKHSEKAPRELFTMSASFLAGRIHGLANLYREERGTSNNT